MDQISEYSEVPSSQFLETRSSHKNILQEYCHLYNLPLPTYETYKESGSDHKPQFRSMCKMEARKEMIEQKHIRSFEIRGDLCSRKKCAELSAAANMLMRISDLESEMETKNVTIEKIIDLREIYARFINETVPYIFFWDVENYKLTEKLQEFEPCIIVAFDSEGSDSASSLNIASQLLTHEESRLLQITSPTRLQDGADIAIIWAIAESRYYYYYYYYSNYTETDCIILSHDKIFCTLKDICDNWNHGFKSVTIMT